MNDIQVSVYCLAYNHEKYIKKTLEGFVSQFTNFKFEVIVHDDASTDNTPKIIREYADKFPEIIKPIFQVENQYSKNKRILKDIILPYMHGKYIAVCEGDDYWSDPLKLQKQYDVLEKHAECSICVHKVECCNEDGSVNERVIPETKYNLRETQCISENEMISLLYEKGGYPFHTSSYFYRKEVTEVPMDYPRDVGTLRKAIIIGKVFFLNESMSVRRLFSVGSWNSKLKESGAKGRIKIIVGDLDYEMNFDKTTNYIYHEIIINRCFLDILSISNVYGDAHLAKELFIKYGIHIKDVRPKLGKSTFLFEFHYWLIMNCTIMESIYYRLRNIMK